MPRTAAEDRALLRSSFLGALTAYVNAVAEHAVRTHETDSQYHGDGYSWASPQNVVDRQRELETALDELLDTQ